MLKAIYSNGNDDSFQIIVHAIWLGSVNVNYSVIADKADSSTVAAKSLDIVSGEETVVLFGTNTSAISMTVGGQEVDNATDACTLSVRLFDECDTCTIVNGQPECRREESQDLAIILGLAIGIPLFIILTVIVAVSLVLCRRKKSSYTERDFSVQQSVPGLNWRQHKLMQLSMKGEHTRPGFTTYHDVDASGLSSNSTVLRGDMYLPTSTALASYGVMDGDRRIYQRHLVTFDDEVDTSKRMFTIPRPEYDEDVNPVYLDNAEGHRRRSQQDSRYDLFTSATNQF